MELPSLEPNDLKKNANPEYRGSILIVDDSPENLHALKIILEEHYYHVRAAINGDLALESMRVEPPDLVLLDIMMPNKNGFQVCEEMKSLDITKDIPVLFISALDDLADKIKSFAVGGVDYIPKPFYAYEVIARVNTHISLYKTRNELLKVNQQLVDHSRNLERLNKELSEFSYSVSHDLRSPLRSIAGFGHILLEDHASKLDDEAKNHLNTIIRNTARMERLIDDLLQLAKISQYELTRTEVNISETFNQSLKELLDADRGKHVDVFVAGNAICSCSPTLVKIAITNLLSNAWKYTEYVTNPKIEFGLTDIDGKETYYIRDNGIGFDMKYVDKIFLPFHRLHRDNRYDGSGIGLATVRKIIEVHHGAIWAESELNKGSTFYFRFG